MPKQTLTKELEDAVIRIMAQDARATQALQDKLRGANGPSKENIKNLLELVTPDAGKISGNNSDLFKQNFEMAVALFKVLDPNAESYLSGKIKPSSDNEVEAIRAVNECIRTGKTVSRGQMETAMYYLNATVEEKLPSKYGAAFSTMQVCNVAANRCLQDISRSRNAENMKGLDGLVQRANNLTGHANNIAESDFVGKQIQVAIELLTARNESGQTIRAGIANTAAANNGLHARLYRAPYKTPGLGRLRCFFMPNTNPTSVAPSQETPLTNEQRRIQAFEALSAFFEKNSAPTREESQSIAKESGLDEAVVSQIAGLVDPKGQLRAWLKDTIKEKKALLDEDASLAINKMDLKKFVSENTMQFSGKGQFDAAAQTLINNMPRKLGFGS